MREIKKIQNFTDLLSTPQITEEIEIRSSFGVCALHGGGLERATEAVARDVAKNTDSSYYAVLQPEGSRLHLSSKYFDPKKSLKLNHFLKNIDTLVSIHGYGKEDDFWALLLGGSNREMAYHLAGSLRGVLPEEYRVVDQIDQIPLHLRGIHPDNPVNCPINGGVQIEIPPGLRWNREYNFWSDADGTPRSEDLNLLIKGLISGINSWHEKKN
ncbi:MAG: Uncharacterised protein [Acidimicrobiaceae bacterium]|nr:hypothetical protein [Acidimicrobiaceae bacterium]CAI8423234.1 MAG: Uncharacterised protein [Acidimicrobiaceae bacterium]|tara:strand:+ start:2371 stop:3009 length:639 start_codon:yes stop_codon:yes gene_type:complete